MESVHQHASGTPPPPHPPTPTHGKKDKKTPRMHFLAFCLKTELIGVSVITVAVCSELRHLLLCVMPETQTLNMSM